MSFNKIIVVGNLGRDPELRYTPQGIPVCTFSVATNERRRDSAGELQERTLWFRVTAWRRLAELTHQYLRKGNTVEVWMIAVRSRFQPWKIEVNQGDKVIIHLTNIEQTTDELHGFAICEYNINVVVDPGETKTIEFVANKPGVFPFYCTNFCSALHQEMQGYLLVKPKGGATAMK